MKDFNSYIIEKLKIDKDTKIDKDDLANLIISVIQYDTEDNDVLEEVENWIKENDVELISIYINNSNENGKRYRDSLDKEVKNKVKFVSISKYIEEFNKIFPKVADYNKFIKFANNKFSMKATNKGIEFERKEYEILVKRETTIYDL